MRAFKEFIEKNIAVSFENAEERLKFYDLCESNGLKPGYPDQIDRPFSSESFLTSGRRFKDEVFEDIGIKIRKGYVKIPAAEFLTQSTPTIEIFQSKQSVVCLKKQDNKVVAVGKARCNPDDVFDFEFGATLAYQRMIGIEPPVSDDGIKTLKNGMRIKKQDKYEVGDLVLIKKKPDRSYGKEYYGKTGTIKEMKPSSFNTPRYQLDIDSKYYWFDSDIKGKVIQ